VSADPVALLEARFRAAIAATLGGEPASFDPVIKPSANPQFGDFQANFAMGLAKQRGMNPRELATKVAAAVDLSGLALPPEVAGPGFINLKLDPAALAGLLGAMERADLGVVRVPRTHGVAVDLCGVNVAKRMHVGHLRATIIGDCVARVFERLGRRVFRENHLGDWGLPIAMTLASLRKRGVDLDRLELKDLDVAYRAAQASAKGDEKGLAAARAAGCGPHRIAELEAQEAGAREAGAEARQALVRLQSGDAELVRDWHKLIECTMKEVYLAADLLNVRLGPENSRGESFYRDRLGPAVEAFVQAGLGVEDDGALVVRFADRERPLLIRKSDGGFLYATTDLCALRFRVQDLDCDRVIYVVDARQRDHFRDVFDACHLIGWDRTEKEPGAGTTADITHLGFGAVLGPDKKPLKTRSGENVTLMSLLEAAIDRGVAEVTKRSADPEAPTHGLSPAELAAIGRAVGIAAVKFADLSNDVSRDYEFDLDRMVAFEGDTGPYIQYAHARIASIIARSGESVAAIEAAPLRLEVPAERALALHLLRYGAMVQGVADSLETSRIGAYLLSLSTHFNAFYQACPVLKAPDEATRRSRLRLCEVTRRVLADGLGLMGIEAPSRM
jgi:arginyl-tRNA synthetase